MLVRLLLNGSNMIKLRAHLLLIPPASLYGLPTPRPGLQTGEASPKRLLFFFRNQTRLKFTSCGIGSCQLALPHVLSAHFHSPGSWPRVAWQSAAAFLTAATAVPNHVAAETVHVCSGCRLSRLIPHQIGKTPATGCDPPDRRCANS